MGFYNHVLFLLILFSLSPRSQSWGWFSSSTETHPTSNSQKNDIPHGSVVEFSMNSLGDQKGMRLVEKAKSKMISTNSCWQNAYRQLFAGCSQILANEEKRSRFAWHLSDCFQKDSGRPAFPYCDTNSAMVNCLKMLNDNEHKVFLEFTLETNSICYQLQLSIIYTCQLSFLFLCVTNTNEEFYYDCQGSCLQQQNGETGE